MPESAGNNWKENMSNGQILLCILWSTEHTKLDSKEHLSKHMPCFTAAITYTVYYAAANGK